MKIQTKIMAVLFLFVALACSKDDNSPVVVTPVKSDAKAITSFSFAADNNAALNSNVSTTVTEASKTVSSSVPNGTDVTALTPTIQISAKASISPIGVQDFSSPVTYTVTAEDGSTAAYRASIMVMASDAKQIVSFVFNSDANDALNEDVGGEIDETEKTIAVNVPSGTDITTLSPSLEIPENASIDPTGAQDFSEPVMYTVTAEDGSIIEYEVSVVVTISQKDALIAIFNANPNNELSWILVDDIDTWEGVQLNEEGMVTRLSIGGKGLTTLPKEIGVLTSLEDLYARQNQLTSLPAEIEALTSLEDLDLRQNQLTSLPSEIGQLTNLDFLVLNFNELEELPAEIGQLVNLTILGISVNRLTDLPIEFWQLSNLSFLSLTGNQLSSIPKEIGQLTQVSNLNLSGNELLEIPPEIGQLTRLRELRITSNQLSSIPVQIGQLTNLRELHLSTNQLGSVPIQIGQLARLERLELAVNQLTTLPSEMGQLSNLTWLNLLNNNLSSLPNEIGQLVKLEFIDIRSNLELVLIPASICALETSGTTLRKNISTNCED